MTRDERRARKRKVKARVKRTIESCWTWGDALVSNPKRLALMVETHMRPCSCPGCSAPSYDRGRAVREARAEIDRDMAPAIGE